MRYIFFFQAEDGIRDYKVTGVQTCALPIWKDQGVQEITQYTSLVPQITAQTAQLVNGAPGGSNFQLVAGRFLWVKFPAAQVLDLGVNPASPLNLSAGVNLLSYSHFPSDYSAYQLLQQ